MFMAIVFLLPLINIIITYLFTLGLQKTKYRSYVVP